MSAVQKDIPESGSDNVRMTSKLDKFKTRIICSTKSKRKRKKNVVQEKAKGKEQEDCIFGPVEDEVLNFFVHHLILHEKMYYEKLIKCLPDKLQNCKSSFDKMTGPQKFRFFKNDKRTDFVIDGDGFVTLSKSNDVYEQLLEYLNYVSLESGPMHYLDLIQQMSYSPIEVRSFFENLKDDEIRRFFEKQGIDMAIDADGYVDISSDFRVEMDAIQFFDTILQTDGSMHFMDLFEKLRKSEVEFSDMFDYFMDRDMREFFEYRSDIFEVNEAGIVSLSEELLREDIVIEALVTILGDDVSMQYLDLVSHVSSSVSAVQTFFNSFSNSDKYRFFKLQPDIFVIDDKGNVSLMNTIDSESNIEKELDTAKARNTQQTEIDVTHLTTDNLERIENIELEKSIRKTTANADFGFRNTKNIKENSNWTGMVETFDDHVAMSAEICKPSNEISTGTNRFLNTFEKIHEETPNVTNTINDDRKAIINSSSEIKNIQKAKDVGCKTAKPFVNTKCVINASKNDSNANSGQKSRNIKRKKQSLKISRKYSKVLHGIFCHCMNVHQSMKLNKYLAASKCDCKETTTASKFKTLFKFHSSPSHAKIRLLQLKFKHLVANSAHCSETFSLVQNKKNIPLEPICFNKPSTSGQEMSYLKKLNSRSSTVPFSMGNDVVSLDEDHKRNEAEVGTSSSRDHLFVLSKPEAVTGVLPTENNLQRSDCAGVQSESLYDDEPEEVCCVNNDDIPVSSAGAIEYEFLCSNDSNISLNNDKSSVLVAQPFQQSITTNKQVKVIYPANQRFDANSRRTDDNSEADCKISETNAKDSYDPWFNVIHSPSRHNNNLQNNDVAVECNRLAEDRSTKETKHSNIRSYNDFPFDDCHQVPTSADRYDILKQRPRNVYVQSDVDGNFQAASLKDGLRVMAKNYDAEMETKSVRYFRQILVKNGKPMTLSALHKLIKSAPEYLRYYLTTKYSSQNILTFFCLHLEHFDVLPSDMIFLRNTCMPSITFDASTEGKAIMFLVLTLNTFDKSVSLRKLDRCLQEASREILAFISSKYRGAIKLFIEENPQHFLIDETGRVSFFGRWNV